MHKSQWSLGSDFDKTAFYSEVERIISSNPNRFLTIKISDRPADINSATAETIAIILNTAIDDAATSQAIVEFAAIFFDNYIPKAIRVLANKIDRMTILNEDGNEILDALITADYTALYRLMDANQNSIDQIVTLSNIADNF